MPLRFACPRCQKPMQVDDRYAAMPVKCPGCGNVVTAPARAPVAAAPASGGGDAFDFYGSQSTAADKEALRMATGPAAAGWRSLGAGLNLIWLGSGVQVLAVTVVWLVSSIIFGAGAQVLSKAEEGETPPVAKSAAAAAAGLIVTGIVLTTLAVGTLLRLIGFVRTLNAPPESGAKGLAVAMLGAELALLGGTAAALTGTFLLEGLVVLGGFGTTALAFVVGLVLMLLFVRQIGQALTSKKIAEKLHNFVVWLGGGLTTVVLVGGGYIGMTMFLAPGTAARVLGSMTCLGTVALIAVVVIVGLTLLVKYLGLLTLASDEVRRRVGK